MTYRGTISLSTAHLTHLADLVRAHRNRIGSRWRRLDPGQQALLVLAHLRNGDTYARLAEGFAVGVATVYRYVSEAVDLLAAAAPSLQAALWRLCSRGIRWAVLDGTVARIDRVGGILNRRFYSGKHKYHGVNLQGLIDPYGHLVWISDGLPGSTHDLTAARTHNILVLAELAEVDLLGDKGYQGAGHTVDSPHKGNPDRLTDAQLDHNYTISSLRAPGERGFATLKAWKILTRYRGNPYRVGTIAQAILTLHLGPDL